MNKLIKLDSLPELFLLVKYEEKHYTDCFCIEIEKKLSFQEYVEAFYTTPLFKVERFILRFIGKPSSDLIAKQLAQDQTNKFAAWTVEQRTENQLLLCDFMQKTRSCLMTESKNGKTKLYFGSAVIFELSKKNNTLKEPLGFSLLSWFHLIYSKALLRAAFKRLNKD